MFTETEMDYYQGVVNEYLRANRATFINTEFCIQLSEGNGGLTKGSHWYCDAVVLSFEERIIYLCEISFATNVPDLKSRLQAWSNHWEGIKTAVKRDGHFNGALDNWAVKPWIFIPREGSGKFDVWAKSSLNFKVKITTLEETQPWNYRSWDRKIVVNPPEEGKTAL